MHVIPIGCVQVLARLTQPVKSVVGTHPTVNQQRIQNLASLTA